MTRLNWGDSSKHYEYGVSNVALYIRPGSFEAWNGIVSIEENTEPAQLDPLYFDGQLINLKRIPGNFKATIRAHTIPSVLQDYLVTNWGNTTSFVGTRRSQPVHLAYKTRTNKGEKIHLVYNCVITPKEFKSDTTVNEFRNEPFTFDVVALPVSYGVNIYPHTGNRYDTPNLNLLPPPPGSDPSAYEDYYKNRYIEDQIPGLPPFIYPDLEYPNLEYPYFEDHLDLGNIRPTPNFVFDESLMDFDKWLSLNDMLFGGIDVSPEFGSPQVVFDLMLGPNPALGGLYIDPDLGGLTGDSITWGPIANSYNMVQPWTGAEIHSASMIPERGDIHVLSYVEDDSSNFYSGPSNGVADRAGHMIVASRVSSDGTITHGTPYQISVADGNFDDQLDLCYIGKGVYAQAGRRATNVYFLKLDPETLTFTEIHNVPSPEVRDGLNTSNAINFLSDHKGNAIICYSQYAPGVYPDVYESWVSTDGNTVTVTESTGSLGNFVPYGGEPIAVSGGFFVTYQAGGRYIAVDWGSQSYTVTDIVNNSSNKATSFYEETAVSAKPAGVDTAVDLVWPTNTDSLYMNRRIPITDTSFSGGSPPTFNDNVGQASSPPYMNWVQMDRFPDGSNILTYMDNGNTRWWNWVDVNGVNQDSGRVRQLASPSSYWFYDGITVTYVGNGKIVMCWTENKEGVEEWGNEIYWRTAQLNVPGFTWPS